MSRNQQQSGLLKQTAAMIALLLMAGCSLFLPEPPPPVEEPKPVAVQTPPLEPVARPAPVVSAKPLITPPLEVSPPLVAVLLSSRRPAYESVATELHEYLDNYTVFDLSDKSQPPVSAFRIIEDSETSAVVAIGLRAAISALSLSKVPVIFCQVFNVQDHDLVTDNSRGVATLPPLDLQIAAWKNIDPTLKSIGAIIGEGHDDLIAEAELAAATHGIQLHIKTAKSDRETLYLFHRLVGTIDGFWLFPDNRVLSGPVLQEMMKYAERHRVQVAVFNDSLLEMGGSISSSPVESNIAETIARVLDQVASGGIQSVAPVTALSDIRVVTREHLLQSTDGAGPAAADQARVANEQ